MTLFFYSGSVVDRHFLFNLIRTSASSFIKYILEAESILVCCLPNRIIAFSFFSLHSRKHFSFCVLWRRNKFNQRQIQLIQQITAMQINEELTVKKIMILHTHYIFTYMHMRIYTHVHKYIYVGLCAHTICISVYSNGQISQNVAFTVKLNWITGSEQSGFAS